MNRYVLAILLALILLCPAVGRAQEGLTFVFDKAAQSGAPGNVLQFSGTVGNVSGQTLYLTFDSLSLTPSAVATADDTSFFDNVTTPYFNGTPVSVPNGGTYALRVFDVTIDPNAPIGATANGLFAVQADTSSDPNNPGAQYTSPDVPFTVTAAAVPEPAPTWPLAAGAVGLAGLHLHRRRSA